jgi:ribosome-associated translation inhibitor RaiA
MKITVSNQTKLSNRYVRYIKWRLYRLKEKFSTMIYADAFLKKEGQRPAEYQLNVRIGLAGKDLIIRNKSKSIDKLMRQFHQDVDRYLSERKLVK